MSGLIPFNKNWPMFRTPGFEEFNNMLDDFFFDMAPSRRNLMFDSFKIDVRELEDSYKIDAELPGVKKEEVSLDLNDGRLTIAVEKKEEVNESNETYIHRERRIGSMKRTVYLSDVNPEDISAKFDSGLLEIHVSKKAKAKKSCKIEIN